VGEENLIGEAGSKSVSGFSGLGRGSRNRSVERRKQEDASVLERRAQSFRDTHLFDASCRAENYVLRAIEKDPQALLFHRCLETTDNRAVLGARKAFGIRISSMLRAGQKIMFCELLRKTRRHSFSIGVWKPPIIVRFSARRE
jgi:hypothetical protein